MTNIEYSLSLLTKDTELALEHQTNKIDTLISKLHEDGLYEQYKPFVRILKRDLRRVKNHIKNYKENMVHGSKVEWHERMVLLLKNIESGAFTLDIEQLEANIKASERYQKFKTCVH